MRPIRWILERGHRVTMVIAILVFVYHVANELRVLFGRPPNFQQRLELTALDVKFAARGKRAPDRWKVAIAAIDEKALSEYGPFPWPRSVLAELVSKLTANGAGSIAFDMTFDHAAPSVARDTAKALAERAKTAGLFDAAADAEQIAASAERVAAALEAKPRKAQVAGLVTPVRTAAGNAKKVAQRIRGFGEALDAAVEGADDDALFAKAIHDSQRVVLGVINLSKLEAEQLEDQLARSLALIASSTISELVSKGDGGLEHVHSNVRDSFETGLYSRFFSTQVPYEGLARATPHFATINALPDDDGVYRRVPLVSTIKGSGVLIPTLGLKAAEVALTPASISVIGRPEDPSPQGVQIGDLFVETELGGTTTLDWYGHFNREEMPIFSIADLNKGAVPKEEIDGRIFFVAATAAGTHDQRVTPLERAVPGVYIHATLAQNILDGRHMTRPQHIIAIELALFLFVGLIAGFVMTKLNVIGQVLCAFAMTAGWLAFDQLVLFKSGLVVYNVLPVFQIFLTLLAVALWRFLVEQREREKTKQAFGRYLAPAVMDQVLANPEQYLKLGGRRYEATVLFSDIRGFTTISEALSPEELGMLLNRYMTPMTDIVFKHGGTLDKYIGDAVMAFWGAPLEQHDHALRACRASLEMIARVEDLNKEFEVAGLPRIAIGIGLSSGPMTIGNMGSDDHFSYTALGDRVNLGARLEGQTKDYGVDIIISDACYQYVKDVMLCRELGALRVKGKYEPVRIYQLIGEVKEAQPRMSFVTTFHDGLEAYRAQKWDEAIEHFTRARALSGINGDKCSDQYIMWCLEYKEQPPPPGWDGVRIATSK